MSVRILQGDCRSILATLPDESVHCVVTSPPYWGLRDYGTAQWSGGETDCDHQNWRNGQSRADGIVDGRRQRSRDGQGSMGGDCRKCGAIRADRQIGLEGSFAGYVEIMRNVFAQVWRVLRNDGTVWLNLGDRYAGDGRGGGNGHDKQSTNVGSLLDGLPLASFGGVKAKNLLGMPWRVAFALQSDGWYLRSDIIWSKPNPMPESVTDRPTKAHEYLFLFAKSERYFYDGDAIREPHADPERGKGAAERNNWSMQSPTKSTFGQTKETIRLYNPLGRNRRSVWEIATSPFSGAHFATFPPALIEPCILAGCPKGGTVLDPFGGAGTTGMVADRLGRNAILIELNPEYADMAERRIRGDAGMFAQLLRDAESMAGQKEAAE